VTEEVNLEEVAGVCVWLWRESAKFWFWSLRRC